MAKTVLMVILMVEVCSCVHHKSSDDDVTTFRFENSDADAEKQKSRLKFVDVYTNHPDVKEVETHFLKLHPQNKNYSLYHIIRDRRPKFITDRKDILNFPNLEDLYSSAKNDFLESDYGDFESPTSQYFDTGSDPDNDINKYRYPKRPARFNTQKQPTDGNKNEKDDDNLVFLQSQVIIPDAENYGSFYIPSDLDSSADYQQDKRPSFWTKKQNFSVNTDQIPGDSDGLLIPTRPYSYVQKIPALNSKTSTTPTPFPEPEDTDSTKYEEVDLFQGNHQLEDKPKGTRKQINDMMKRYLATLLVEKYGIKNGDNQGPKNKTSIRKLKNSRKNSHDFNMQTPENLQKIDQESKFIYNNALWDLKNRTLAKIKQFFSLFTVINFNNTECNATNWAGTWQGICLTALECTQQNGSALGNCAGGYGICCVFRGSCGDSSSRNCSYFKSPNYPDYYPSNGGVITPTTTEPPTTAATPDPRLYWYYYNKGMGDTAIDELLSGRQSTSDTMSCTFSVSKSTANVQQYRIDFVDLDLASPTNGTCVNERLVITGQNANDQIPVICGYNTGQHVYVDVSQLTGPLQIMVLSTTGARKRFKLKICQYTDTCSSSQSNCLQYYTGVSGVIQSFNYDQAAMFARSRPGYFNNLNYAICIRREAGYCSITYRNTNNGVTYPFQMVNSLANGQSTVPGGQAGVDVLNCPDDYVIVDGTRLCGDRFNDGSTAANFSLNAPVVDTSAGPIVLNVRTNGNVTGLGFKLYYMQNLCSAT